MRVSVTSDYRFITTADGAVWTDGPCHYDVWRRLLVAFDEVNVPARMTRADEPRPTWRRADGPGVRFSPLPNYLGPWQYARRRAAIRRAAAAAVRSDDAVILNVPGQIGTALRSTFAPDRPYAVQILGDPYDVFAPGVLRHPLRPLLRTWCTRQLRRHAAGAVGALYVTQHSLQARYPCPAHMVGVSDVDLGDESLVDRPRPATDGTMRIVSVGTMTQLYKGFDVLLEAAAGAVRTAAGSSPAVDLHLTLVGDGKFRPQLEALVDRLELRDRVTFRGQRAAGSQVREDLDAADLFVLPSRTEGLPRALVEAMARGLPCLASRVGGIPELLAEEDLVPPGDATAWTAALVAVAADPPRRARMAVRNLAHAANYRAEVLSARRGEFYRYVAAETAALAQGEACVVRASGRAPTSGGSAMKIAVTGATGFIGRKVVEHHLAAGDEVRILSRRPAAEIVAAFQPSDAAILNFFQGDLTSDAPLPVEFVEGADVLYHCAGELVRVERMRGLHVDGTRRLIELAAGRIGRWVQLSSVGAYGLRRSGVVDESTPQKSVGEYETTKTEADAIVEAAGARGAFDFTILRPTIVFGDDMPNGSLRAWIDAVRRGRFFFVGPSGASANYVHVDDVVRALTTAAVHPAARGRTFIVADGRTVEQFVQGICAASQCRPPQLRVPATMLGLAAQAAQFLPRSPLTPARVAALTTRVTYAADRIRRELGFETVTSVEAGLRSLVARIVAEERESAAARPIRLAHVMTSPMSLLFFGGQVGHLRRSGFDVTMISAPGDMLDEFGRRESVPTHAVPMVRPIAPGSDLVSLLRLRSLLRRLRPDVVHCHTPKAGLLGTIAARAAGVPVVFLSVFGVPQMTRSGLMRRLLDFTTRLSCRLADVVWCDSRSMARYVADERLCEAAKIRVFGAGSVNGVDTAEAFDPARFDEGARHELRASYGIPPTAPTAIFVGRITRDKGIRELAAAWRTVRERIADAHLLIVGPLDEAHGLSGEDEAALRSDPRIHLAGMRRDVARHLAAADVFVNPSYREGFGIANLEASAMGLPVLSTRIPGCVDSVQDGVTGVLVPSHDAPALADALERYFRDADLRRRHGVAGRERAVRDFQPATIWRELEQAYRERRAAALRPKPSRTYLVVKRAVDLAVAAVGLVALAPVLLTTALAVRWTMGGPVLFRQLRPGRGGRPFTMFKFRTMTEAAGAAPADDARRLTRLGKFLRSTSLDELPELLNVLRGDMSLVGPRPLLMQYLDRYTPEQARRHEAKPGITGWAQVNGRNDVDWNERLALDVWYVDHRSLALDVKILLRTIGVVFSRRGVSAAGQATMTEFQGTSSTAASVGS